MIIRKGDRVVKEFRRSRGKADPIKRMTGFQSKADRVKQTPINRITGFEDTQQLPKAEHSWMVEVE